MEETLIQWEDDGGESPTWEPLSLVRRRFPTLILEDKDVSIRGELIRALLRTRRNSAGS